MPAARSFSTKIAAAAADGVGDAKPYPSRSAPWSAQSAVIGATTSTYDAGQVGLAVGPVNRESSKRTRTERRPSALSAAAVRPARVVRSAWAG